MSRFMANVILSKLATDNINEILANVYEFTGFISNPHFHLKSVACIHDFVRSVHLDAQPNHARNVIHDFVQQVARYDPRSTHTRNEIKCGDFCVCFFKQHIINHQERYSFRATSCTLRFTISCNKLHATIYDFVQQVVRYDL